MSLETVRVRDLLRYFQPVKPSQAAQTQPALPPGINYERDCTLPFDPTAAHPPKLSPDPTLTSLAQLGALRLNCQRAFISLMDHKNQFIIAEATRSVSSYDVNQHDQDDGLFIGARVQDLVWGVCPNTIEVFTCGDGSMDIESEHITANSSCYVIRDLSRVDEYKSRTYVVNWPFMKFYAEVPIRTPNGNTIGTFCVVDDQPHRTLNEKDLACMTEISTTIMRHLELIRTGHLQFRAVKLLKSLSLFVDGQANLEDDDDDFAAWVQLNTISAGSASAPDPAFMPKRGPAGLLDKSPALPSIEIDSQHVKTSADSPPPSQAPSVVDGGAAPEPEHSRNIFARASTLLRQALDLDGIVFLDARGADRSVLDEPAPPLRERAVATTPIRTQDHDHRAKRPSLTSTRSAAILKNASHKLNLLSSADAERQCPALGASMQDDGEEDATEASQPKDLSLSSTQIRKLLQDFPKGELFNFIEAPGAGIVDTSRYDRDQWPGGLPVSDPAKDSSAAADLRKLLPNASTLMFLPLLSSHRDRWFTVIMAWSNSSTRVFESQDLSYISAFGNSVMAEVARADALLADSAKSKFISSISHELRSPLHGLLANAEALHDVSTGPMQDDLIRSIEICGETLLDTMNHLLDYAKGNELKDPVTKPKLLKGPGAPTASSTESTDASSQVNLVDLVEDVVQSTYSGQHYTKEINTARRWSSSRATPAKEQAMRYFEDGTANGTNSAASDVGIIVTVNVDPRASWVFQTTGGAWKRILMNVFGNALKYTYKGFVEVELGCDEPETGSSGDLQVPVWLSIRDTGKGMSKHFYRNHLYTPFVQEDPLSVGTGLGLSIVQQLATDLHGHIEVESESGVGTNVKVTIPLKQAETVATPSKAISLMADVRSRSTGLKFCLLGLDTSIENASTDNLYARARHLQLQSLERSVRKTVEDWFGLDVVICDSLPVEKADFYFITQSHLQSLGSKWHDYCLRLGLHRSDFLVFGGNATYSQVELSAEYNGVTYLPQPLSPQKIGKALSHSLDAKAGKVPPPSEAESRRTSTSSQASTPSSKPRLAHDHPLSHPVPAPTTPVSTSAISRKRKASASLDDLTQSRGKILLVEDNPINMKVLQMHMHKLNYNYECAVNGLQAVQMYESAPEKFGVILMDVSMPVMDGLTATAHIRRHELDNDLTPSIIIAVTCLSAGETRDRALGNGFDLYLVKPIPMKKLGSLLENAVAGTTMVQ